jgi:hypothetical protein
MPYEGSPVPHIPMHEQYPVPQRGSYAPPQAPYNAPHEQMAASSATHPLLTGRPEDPGPQQNIIARDGETALTWGNQGVLERRYSTSKIRPPNPAVQQVQAPYPASSAAGPSTHMHTNAGASSQVGPPSQAMEGLSTSEIMSVLQNRLANERGQSAGAPEVEAPPSYQDSKDVI